MPTEPGWKSHRVVRATLGPLLLIAAVLTRWPSVAAAEDTRMRITLRPPTSLTVGDHGAVIAEVDSPERHPILVTPTSEGRAIQVVRGRLLRADAERPDAPVLKFRVPILARLPGTSVLRVHVRGWACKNKRCRAVVGEASVVLRVERPRE